MKCIGLLFALVVLTTQNYAYAQSANDDHEFILRTFKQYTLDTDYWNGNEYVRLFGYDYSFQGPDLVIRYNMDSYWGKSIGLYHDTSEITYFVPTKSITDVKFDTNGAVIFRGNELIKFEKKGWLIRKYRDPMRTKMDGKTHVLNIEIFFPVNCEPGLEKRLNAALAKAPPMPVSQHWLLTTFEQYVEDKTYVKGDIHATLSDYRFLIEGPKFIVSYRENMVWKNEQSGTYFVQDLRQTFELPFKEITDIGFDRDGGVKIQTSELVSINTVGLVKDHGKGPDKMETTWSGPGTDALIYFKPSFSRELKAKLRKTFQAVRESK